MNPVSSYAPARELAASLSRLQPGVESAMARLSSGQRLDRPGRDAPAVGQMAKLESEEGRWRAVEVNLQNGMSRLQATQGFLQAMARQLTRLGELHTLVAGNPTLSPGDQNQYRSEFKVLQEQLRATIGGPVAEIGGTADLARPLGSYQGRPLFGGGVSESLALGLSAAESLTLPTVNLRGGFVGEIIRHDGGDQFVFGPGQPGAGDVLQQALDQVGQALAATGAGQSRLEQAGALAMTRRLNHESALTSLRDVDLATETTRLTRLQMRQESHTAMLAQAQTTTERLLPLLARR